MTVASPLLVQATRKLQRRVFASFPWGYRVASALFELRLGADSKTFGRVMYGLFLLGGVTDLPPVPIPPKTTRDIDRLPDGYGAELGTVARGIASRYLDDTDVEDILTAVVLRALSDSTLRRGIAGKSLAEARRYVLRTVQNACKDYLRALKVRRYTAFEMLLQEPTSSWAGLEDMLPRHEVERIQEQLDEANPELGRYLELLLDGFSNQAIADHRMLPSLRENPVTQQALAKRMRGTLKRIVGPYLRVGSAHVVQYAWYPGSPVS